MAILQPESLLSTRHTLLLARSHTHTPIHTQQCNREPTISKLVINFCVRAQTTCCAFLLQDFNHFTWDLCGCVRYYYMCVRVGFPFMPTSKAEVCPCSPSSPKQKSTSHSSMHPFWIFTKGQTSPSAHGDPSILMTVILITMRPLFQIFRHPSSPWFSADLPGQPSQSHMINEISHCVGFKRNDPAFFFFLLSSSLLSPSGGKM